MILGVTKLCKILRLAVQGPEKKSAEFAFAKSRDVDVSRHSSIEFKCEDIVRVSGLDEDSR